VGTGSGAIALAMKQERPDAAVVACDVSPGAVEVASAKAELLGLQVEVIESDLLEAVPGGQFALVVSNPPYVTEEELAGLEPEVARWEPRVATVAGPDGLAVHRRLLPQAVARLTRGGHIVLEGGAGQAPALREALVEAGFTDVGVDRDLAGIERVVWGTWRGACRRGRRTVCDRASWRCSRQTRSTASPARRSTTAPVPGCMS